VGLRHIRGDSWGAEVATSAGWRTSPERWRFGSAFVERRFERRTPSCDASPGPPANGSCAVVCLMSGSHCGLNSSPVSSVRLARPTNLRGSLYCGRCHSRLGLTHSRGRRGGIYPYFFCLGRQRRTGCDLPFLSVGEVEEQVCRAYSHLQLTAVAREEVGSTLLKELADDRAVTGREKARLQAVIAKLDRERFVWAEKVANGSIPDDIGRKKQGQIALRLLRARGDLAKCVEVSTGIEDTAEAALSLLRRCGTAYRQSGAEGRRLWNQAVFERIEVDTDRIVRAKVTPGFGALIDLPPHDTITGDTDPGYGRSSTNSPATFLVGGSSKTRLVGAEGLEPPTCWL
jgi:site-specific DNA recombinase